MNKHQRIVRMGLFFDGTSNNQNNVAPVDDDGRNFNDDSYANARSNIALLHALYPCGDVGQQVFFKLYVEGIGTRAGEADTLFGKITGRGATGVQARVEQTLLKVGELLRDYLGDEPQAVPERVEFDLFGFSRGAAAARHLANRLGAGEPGLPVELQGERQINFIGLFDTVAAIVAPLQGNFSPANTDYGGLRLGLGRHVARQVVQLVAGHEQRHNFPLVSSANDIVVPGVHSNIGGGYLETMREHVLLCKPHVCRVSRTKPVEQTSAWVAANALLATAFADVAEPRPQLLTWEEPVAGGRARREDLEKLVYAAVYREREVSGHLSRVYLSLMRELGVRGGVPFMPLGDDEAHRLPDELGGISAKLHDHVLGAKGGPVLSADEEALLQWKYVHHSANWNAPGSMRGSPLDVIYFNRPAEGGRVVHENPVD